MARSIGNSRRFEIFKRDGFTCQYCGAHPPDVVLEVDHIVPVAAGGGDEDTNLVTACFACNRGKAARDLNVIPASLGDRAAEVEDRERQLAGFQAILRAQRERVEDDVWRVFLHWTGKEETTKDRYASVQMFVKHLGVDQVLDAVDITMLACPKNEFRFFCGVCWNKIRDAGL
jgi:hypothetical protein